MKVGVDVQLVPFCTNLPKLSNKELKACLQPIFKNKEERLFLLESILPFRKFRIDSNQHTTKMQKHWLMWSNDTISPMGFSDAEAMVAQLPLKDIPAHWRND